MENFYSKCTEDDYKAGNAMKENLANFLLDNNTTVDSSEYGNNVSIFEIICDKIKKEQTELMIFNSLRFRRHIYVLHQ